MTEILYIYSKSKGWIEATDLKYKATYDWIKSSTGLVFTDGSITTTKKISKSHRGCIINIVLQYDSSTNGLRYIAYAQRIESDYGIGVTLNSIGYKDLLEYMDYSEDAAIFID